MRVRIPVGFHACLDPKSHLPKCFLKSSLTAICWVAVARGSRLAHELCSARVCTGRSARRTVPSPPPCPSPVCSALPRLSFLGRRISGGSKDGVRQVERARPGAWLAAAATHGSLVWGPPWTQWVKHCDNARKLWWALGTSKAATPHTPRLQKAPFTQKLRPRSKSTRSPTGGGSGESGLRTCARDQGRVAVQRVPSRDVAHARVAGDVPASPYKGAHTRSAQELLTV